MTTPTQGEHAQPAPRAIQRFEVVDCIDSQHVPAVIPRANGPWVRYEDHAAQVAALTAAPQGGAYAELPRVGAIGYASVVDIESYVKTLTIGPRLPGVRDVALWSTDQMRAYADATHALRVASHGQAPAGACTAGNVHPRHPVVVKWRNNGIEACAGIAEAYGCHDAARDMRAMLTTAPTAQPAPAATPQADSQPAPQGETNAQLDTDSNSSAPGQQRDVAGTVALGQPVGHGSDSTAGDPSAQGDKLLTVAERNIRSFLRSATFKSESDREAALNCVDVLWAAARAPADSVTAPAAGAVAGPEGWITWWPTAQGVRDPIYSHGPEKPSHGPELDAVLRKYPVFAASPTPAAKGDALDRVTNFRHEAEGMVRGGEWVRLSDVRAALAQKEGNPCAAGTKTAGGSQP